MRSTRRCSRRAAGLWRARPVDADRPVGAGAGGRGRRRRRCTCCRASGRRPTRLHDRGLRDRAPYQVWAEQGLLHPGAGQGAGLRFPCRRHRRAVRPAWYSLQRIAYDRWRIDVLAPVARQRLGVLVDLMDRSARASRTCRRRSRSSSSWRSPAGSARRPSGAALGGVEHHDRAGRGRTTASSTRRRSYGRIDPAVAAIMAVAAMKLQTEAAPLDVADLGVLNHHNLIFCNFARRLRHLWRRWG